MGPKGGNVQKITSENNVQIKFPEKRSGNGTPNGNFLISFFFSQLN